MTGPWRRPRDHADAQHNRELLQRLRDQQQPPPSSESESKEGDQSQEGQGGWQ
jgi:hypothetical protein